MEKNKKSNYCIKKEDKMKRKTVLLLLLLILGTIVYAEIKPELRIGVVYDGEKEENEVMKKLLFKEFNNILGSEHKIIFPENRQLIDSFDKKGIEEKLEILLNDDEIDIIVTAGVLSSYIAINYKELKKPVFSPFIFKELEKNVRKKNLNYILLESDIKMEIENFRKIAYFDKIKILIGSEIAKLIPEIGEKFIEYNEKSNMNIEYEIVIVDENIPMVLEEIKDAEAVYIGPLGKLSTDEKKSIYNYINDNKIPSFSMHGAVDIKDGILAGYSYEKVLKKSIRTIGLNLSSYLDGEKMIDLPVEMSKNGSELLLNMKVVEETGIWPNWNIISSAKLINFSEKKVENELGLKKVVEIVLENNSEIEALKQEVEISNLEIKKAKSNYLPSLGIDFNGVLLDADRAESMMSPAEKTLSAGAKLTQVIYSDDVSMNIDIKRKQNNIKKEELKQKELDLTLETAIIYMNILKAKAYSKIQKNSLELTKTNLEIARSRKKAGISGSADIYRWEAKFANSISALMEAILNVEIAKKDLKRIMNWDLSKEINLEDVNHNMKMFITSQPGMKKYIENKKELERLIKFLTIKSFLNSPELRYIENGKEIQKRVYKNRGRKRYIPTVAIQASYEKKNILESGAGEEELYFSDEGLKNFGELLGAFGDQDDNDWSVGINFSIPIYSGGKIKQERNIAKKEIDKLEYQRESIKKRFEQRVATYVIKITSDLAKIKNAEKASISAHKALDLVKDAYLKGVVSMSELIEVQTATISTDEYRSALEYDFIISAMNIERATGQYYFNVSEDKKAELIEELVKFGEEMEGKK